jgi:hypothetical protein
MTRLCKYNYLLMVCMLIASVLNLILYQATSCALYKTIYDGLILDHVDRDWSARLTNGSSIRSM